MGQRSASELWGTVRDLRADELLVFLGATGRTGVLKVTGRQHDATIWLVDGTPVAASAEGGATEIVDVVAEAMTTPLGAFCFDASEAGAVQAERKAVDANGEALVLEDVVAAATAQVLRWQEVADVVPSLQVAVRLRQTDVRNDEVRLSSAAWTVSVNVAAGCNTPAGLAGALEWSPLRVCEAVKELVDAGQAELMPPPRIAASAVAVDPASRSEAWPGANEPLEAGAVGSSIGGAWRTAITGGGGGLWPGGGPDQAPPWRPAWGGDDEG